MLATRDVSRSFGGVMALRNVSVAVQPGELVALVGPNGSGKTTMLNVMSGFVATDGGCVELDGRRLVQGRPWELAMQGVRRTFQLPSHPQAMSVLEIMLAGAEMPSGMSLASSIFSRSRQRREQAAEIDRAMALLDWLSIATYAQSPAGTLSGGQQKLLNFGAVLMKRPRFLLADEPTAGVSPPLRKLMVERLKQLGDEGMAILVVEHDMGFVSELCTRCVVLDKGAVIADCAPADLHSDARIVDAFIGSRKMETESRA